MTTDTLATDSQSRAKRDRRAPEPASQRGFVPPAAGGV